jgi:potassium efflux system protein
MDGVSSFKWSKKKTEMSLARTGIAFIALLVVLTLILSPYAYAQPAPDQLTIEQVEDRIASVNDNEALSEDQKTAVVDALNRARDALLVSAERAENLEAFETSARNVAEALADIAARRSELGDSPGEFQDGASVAELEARQSLLEAERQSVVEQLASSRAESLSLSGRATIIADEVIAARNTVVQLSERVNVDLERSEEPLGEANWWLERASLQERQAAIADLSRELETLPARQSLVDAQIDLLEAQVIHLDETISRIRRRLNDSALWRADVAINAARSRMDELERSEAELQELAGGNLALAQDVREGILRRALLEREIATSERKADALRRSSDTMRLVLGAGRLSDETATLLNTVRANLPDTDKINADLFQSERQVGDVQLQLIVWLEELNALESATQIPTIAPDAMNQSDDASDLSIDLASDTRRNLLDVRQSALQLLIEGARQEAELLSEHQLVLLELSQQSRELSSTLDRRLLWLRTSERANWSWMNQIPRGVAWILSPTSWGGAITALLSGAAANAGATGGFLLLTLALLGFRQRLSQMLDGLAKNVGHVGRDTYVTTPFAMGVTALLALPTPLAISFAGWLISRSGAESAAFASGLAQTLILLGPILLVICFFQEMCRPRGVFDEHFNWTEKARTRLSANLRWFVRLETAAIMLFGLTVFSGPPGIAYGVGVVAFVIGSLALAILVFQFLRPKGGIVSQLKIGPTTSVFLKLLLPIAVFEPLFVGVLPFFGFFDTAMQLQYRVLESSALVLVGSVLYGLAVRMFMVGNRRYALERARAKRTQIEVARASEADHEASGEKHGLEIDPSLSDADIISEQIRALFKLAAFGAVIAALWMLWSPLLPALGIADDVSLWTRTVTQNGTITREAVSLLDLLIAVLFLAVAVFAVRNIGGLLEISIFEPFGLDAPTRYAIASITRYIIVAVAIVLGFSNLGANWSELQWIIAALGVGLGFGLQEIVANFVSGLIILFERPVRVGDVVTIGTLSGTVSNIRIRATTITDFENRQVILPNKAIITENVTNWTLEDDVTRLLLRVGVAYGSDVEAVRAIILDTVEAHPDVLAKPAPTVFFMAHGDSALQFEVRFFVGAPMKRLPTTHALNAAINTALKQNGIQIPFPQSDVHVSLSTSQDAKTAKKKTSDLIDWDKTV